MPEAQSPDHVYTTSPDDAWDRFDPFKDSHEPTPEQAAAGITVEGLLLSRIALKAIPVPTVEEKQQIRALFERLGMFNIIAAQLAYAEQEGNEQGVEIFGETLGAALFENAKVFSELAAMMRGDMEVTQDHA